MIYINILMIAQIAASNMHSCSSNYSDDEIEYHGYFRGCDIRASDYNYINAMMLDIQNRDLKLLDYDGYIISFLERDDLFIVSMMAEHYDWKNCDISKMLFSAVYWFSPENYNDFEVRSTMVFEDVPQFQQHCG